MKKSTLLTSLLLAGSVVASPAVFADAGQGEGHNKQDKTWKHQQKEMRHNQKKHQKYDDENRKVEKKRYIDSKYKNYHYYDARTGQYLTKEQYQQLPLGLQKNVARGKAVPPGWAKKLDNRYYTISHYNGKDVYVLNNDVYRNATILSQPRPGEVRIKVDNRVLDVIEATRVILNVL